MRSSPGATRRPSCAGSPTIRQRERTMSVSRCCWPTRRHFPVSSGAESPPPLKADATQSTSIAVSLSHMPLSKSEREEFLAQPHIAALSVNAGDGRGPLTVPIWYQYAPGGEPWVLTGAGSRKTRLIEATGYFSLMVERVEPTLRY